jgi:hypothetical protein
MFGHEEIVLVTQRPEQNEKLWLEVKSLLIGEYQNRLSSVRRLVLLYGSSKIKSRSRHALVASRTDRNDLGWVWNFTEKDIPVDS